MPILNAGSRLGSCHPLFAIYGPSGMGKTHCAATASQFFQYRPADKRQTPIDLSDIIWFSYDPSGHETVTNLNLHPGIIDLGVQPLNIAEWLMEFSRNIALCKQAIADGAIKYVVHDTLSTVNRYFDQHFLADPKCVNPQVAYGRSLAQFSGFMREIRSLAVPQILLMHSRSAYQPEAAAPSASDAAKQNFEALKARKEALAPGEHLVDIDLTPGYSKMIRPICSLIAAAHKEDNKYSLIMRDDGVHYIKSRYEGLFRASEAPNLQALFKRMHQFETSLGKAA